MVFLRALIQANLKISSKSKRGRKRQPRRRPIQKEVQSKVQDCGSGGMREQTSEAEGGGGSWKLGFEISLARVSRAPVTLPDATEAKTGLIQLDRKSAQSHPNMPNIYIFPCTCTETGCYDMISSVVLAHALAATL